MGHLVRWSDALTTYDRNDRSLVGRGVEERNVNGCSEGAVGGCAEAGLAGAAPADGPSRDRRRVEAVDVDTVGWLVLVSPRAGRGGSSRRSCGLVSPQPLNVGQHERPTLAGRLDGARGSPTDVDDVDNNLT